MENKQELPKGTILRSSELSYEVEEILGSGGFGITYKVSANVMHKNIPIHTFFAVMEHFLSNCCERDEGVTVNVSKTLRNTNNCSGQSTYIDNDTIPMWIEDTMAIDSIATDSVAINDYNDLTPIVPVNVQEQKDERETNVPTSRSTNTNNQSAESSKPINYSKRNNNNPSKDSKGKRKVYNDNKPIDLDMMNEKSE